MVRLAALCEWLDGRDYSLGRFTAADILMTTVLRLIRHTDLVAGFSSLDIDMRALQVCPSERPYFGGKVPERSLKVQKRARRAATLFTGIGHSA